MAQYISAKDVLVFFNDPDQLKYLLSDCQLPFFLKYKDGTLSGELRGLYESKERNFFEYLDGIYFEYNTFNALISRNKHYKLIRDLHCDGKDCPLLHGQGQDEIITMAEARSRLGMSRIQFVDFLNNDSGRRLATSWEQGARDYIDRYGYAGSSDIKFFEVANLDDKRLYIEKIDWDSFFGDSRTDQTQGQDQSEYITELQKTVCDRESTIDDLNETIAKLRAEIAALEAEHSGPDTTRQDASGPDSFFAAYPICGVIYELYRKGMKQGEIRAELQRRSLGTVKVLAFLTKDEGNRQSDDALKQDFYRSIKKATKGVTEG